MNLSKLCMAIAALVEISAAAYYLAEQPQGGALVTTLSIHCVAAVLCALAGGALTAPAVERAKRGKPRSSAACFVFYLVPAILLPVGGVITVWVMSSILSAPAAAPRKDALPFGSISSTPVSQPSTLMTEPISGAVRKFPAEDVRAIATGLRAVQPARSTSVLLQYFQQHEDTEVRFRAQGAVSRVTRSADDLLKEISDQGKLTEPQKMAAADACLDLADWSPATGANRLTLVENAIGYLTEEGTASIPRLARLVRAQLAARRNDDAAETVAQLRAAGASEDLIGPMEAELLYQQRNWSALAERCAALPTTNPENSGAVRFWRAAHLAG